MQAATGKASETPGNPFTTAADDTTSVAHVKQHRVLEPFPYVRCVLLYCLLISLSGPTVKNIEVFHLALR
jgi:hypothetical protein